MLGLCSLLVAGTAQAQACPGDTDASGTVDSEDLGNVLAAFGLKGRAINRHFKLTGASVDVVPDLVVNALDTNYVLQNWGPCPPIVDLCSFDLNGDNTVNSADLGILLSSGVADSANMASLLNEWGRDCKKTSGASPALLSTTNPNSKAKKAAQEIANILKAP
jgi:hypothetical protein